MVQHENQALPDFHNITIYGKAHRLTGADYEVAKHKLLERRPLGDYKEDNKNIYKVSPDYIKILDLSKKKGEQVKIIKP